MSLPSLRSIPPRDAQIVQARCRPDLEVVETLHKHESAIVVKDPVAMKYHRLRPDEYFVLQQLDGRRSLEQIRDEYESRFAPMKVTATDLNRLVFRFHQSGLTLSDAAMQGDRLTERRRKDRRQQWMQHISGILFIRFPGVDPEPLLRRLYPMLRPFLSWVGLLTAIALCLGAAVVFVLGWDQFVSEFPRMQQWIRLDAILILAAVIGGTKVLHELGHAVVCKHFGGECHQIGPMLLVFTPALYCDTSDSWMLPSRWQRAAVGLAGIGTEVVLAAIATFIWAWTAPGLTHYIAMNVMLVCSVSTVLFNANPLLRYDGYYVLADLCDVPNLADRSRRLLAGHANRVIFGFDELTPEPITRWATFWTVTYAVCAAVYRWGLTLVILWFVSLILRPYGLESVGRLLCLFAVLGLLFTLLRPCVLFLKNPARRRQIQMARTALSAVAMAAIIGLTFYPLPSGITSQARIIPRQETPLYISTPGRLTSVSVVAGQHVSEGEEVARLENREVELQFLTARGRYQTQESVVESIRRSALDFPQAANELPAQEAFLADLRNQLKTRQSRRDGLILRAPASGTLIESPHIPEQTEPLGRLVNWTGQATESKNQGCLMEPGQELMSVRIDPNWDAEIVLSQSDVQRVSLGADVKLVLHSAPDSPLRGTVTDVSRAEWREEQNLQPRDDRGSARNERPPSTSYVVRVELDDPPVTMITGATAKSRIETPSMSLAHRGWRTLNGLFRFR